MPAPRDRPLLLHITAEYPDPLRDRTTPAVKAFIDQLEEFDHLVISLKRYSDPRRRYFCEFDWDGNRKVVAVGYWAPPGGVLHRPRMRALARRIEALLRRDRLRPVLATAHKLVVEGVIAHELRRRLDLPYACCVRGEVETKFFRFKPGLRGLFGRVIGEAEALYFVSAWFRRWIEARYPRRLRRTSLLPNFVSHATTPAFDRAQPNRLLSVMDLNVYRRKGLPELIQAMALARRSNPDLALDIIGWSSEKLDARIAALIEEAGQTEAIRLLGFVENREVLRRLPRYAGFVLASRNETFGMSYVEALLAGVPILYGRGTGIDGYLDGLTVGIPVQVGDVADIARGLLELAASAPQMRRAIAADYAVLCERFSPRPYLAHYRTLVSEVARRPPAQAAAAAAEASLVVLAPRADLPAGERRPT